MNDKRSPAPDDPEQSRRFVETARQLEADEKGTVFKRAFRRVVPKATKKKR